MDRRTSLKWMLAASAALPLWNPRARGADGQAAPVTGGYGTDPDLLKTYRRGELWPLLLDAAQRRTASALCDVILPGDERSPGAVAVGVVDFLDEWISAPYPRQLEDRPVMLEGLAWMDREARRRFGLPFADLRDAQQRAICDDICREEKVQPAYADAARFFGRYRDLTAGGFYSTPVGRQDIGYIGNVPQVNFAGPPPEVLRKLGLEPAT